MFSGALKGFSSNISTNYTISSTPTTTAGAWNVFDGKNKKTGKSVSVFVFDRKSLEPPGGSGFRSRSNGAAKRKIYDEVVERLKKEANSLARLRHPNVLELAEPVEDTRNGGLMFATESITSTVSGLLNKQEDVERGRGRSASYYGNENGNDSNQEQAIDELEIQKGLLQVAKALEFLHESAGLVHGNLTPDAICINAKSDWKLGGLAFCGPPDSANAVTSTPASTAPIALSELLYYDPRLPKTVQLNLDYTSPDFVLDSNVCSAADMFSLGLVMLSLYNTPHESPLHTNANVASYKKTFSSSSTVPTTNNNFLCTKELPQVLKFEVLPRLITRRPANRMTARDFQQSKFFDNILVSAIKFLDTLPAKTSAEKSQFLRGLPRVLNQFPKSVLDKKVLPALLEEMKDKDLLALILGNVFKMIPLLPSAQRSFTDKILPKLKETFVVKTGKQSTATERDTSKDSGLAIVLDNMGIIAENTNGKEFKDDVLPIVQSGLESSTHALVDKSLSCLSTMMAVLDFSTIKNDLFPVVAHVFTKTSSLAIKIRGLEAFVILCGGSLTDSDVQANSSSILDKYTIQEKIVPLMKGMKTKEPAVMMASLKVFRQVGRLLDSDFLATDILPLLWSFALGPLLNLEQFSQYMTIIKQLSMKIEEDQIRKLRDMTSTNGSFSPTTDLTSPRYITDPFSGNTTSASDFEDLVLGKSTSPTTLQPFTTTLSNTFTAHPGSPVSPSAMWSPNSTTSTSGISRTVTPDTAFSSYQNKTSHLPVRSIPPPPQTASSQISNPWASPTQAGVPRPADSNPWSLQPQSPPNASTTNTSNFNSLPKPTLQPQSPPTNTWTTSNISQIQSLNGLSMSTLQQPLQPVKAGSNAPSLFNLSPPPGMNLKLGTPSANLQQKTQKSGLDAYESLI
ncbi:MAG: hypothetical protein GOMPHAMPRED_004177 [Gomphillus americanus]|uniref:Protein kinase domain-containing protein n=1 Tax=Gomphillus americanus TaxID=1940652 RepID=A0A8H3FRM0_9LECA|nr:MAG: hypothetical protein GOMPHAMPRED_004177 [Gomphillus americanus]